MVGALNLSGEEDILKFIGDNHIRILNLCHIPEDGRLKTLSFSIANKDRIREILDLGERVDGSSLFSFIDPGKSDIYIMPRIERAFVNPFAVLPTLSILCDYMDENGKPLDVSPKNVLARAEEKLHSSTGTTMNALAELEFYIIGKQQSETVFPEQHDKNYHESTPFSRFEGIRNEILATLDNIGIATKYGHSEVGQLWSKDNVLMEQHEIELAPQSLAKTAETISIAKWAIRNISARRGVSASFIPKIDLAHAGTGMHIHMCSLRNGENIVVNSKGTLSSQALRIIGGILKFAPSLSAFGNPTPVSYLRFLARKESPMHICWSARNRLALIRIPLWWNYKKKAKSEGCRETFEYRAPDAFANAYLLLAGLALAANHGLGNPTQAMKMAEDLHVETANRERKELKTLPMSCSESAENLKKDRQHYEADAVFPKRLIDKTVEKLDAYGDKNLRNKISGNSEEIEKMIVKYIHYG